MNAYTSAIAVWNQLFVKSRPAGMTATMTPAAFRDVMREVAAPVTIIAAGSPGFRNGLTATSVCSVSDAPPTTLICVRRSAKAHDVIVNSGHFSINFLSAEQEDVAMQFSGAGGISGEERFSVGDWSTGASGAPILADCMCTLECRLVGREIVATHTIMFGEPVDGHKRESGRALLYRRGGYQPLSYLAGGRKTHDGRVVSENKLSASIK